MNTVIEEMLRNHLIKTEQDIDIDNLYLLNKARQSAVDSISAPRRLRRLLWPTVGMTLASVLVLILAAPFSPFDKAGSGQQLSDNLELYEDFEFYDWLAHNEEDLRG